MNEMNEINVISFNDYKYHEYHEYDEYDEYDNNKIIYIPFYNICAYYDTDKFVVYQLENEFNQNEYYNVKNIMVPESFAQKLKYIFDMENEIKIISKNNKYYMDNI